MSVIAVQSFAGREINDGTRYRAYASFGDRMFERRTKPVLKSRLSRHPTYQRAEREAVKITVRIAILGTSASDTILDRLDELNEWFALETEGELLLNYGDSLRKATGYVEQIIPQDTAANRFTAVISVPDPRWISDREVLYDNAGVSCNGDNLVTDSERDAAIEYDGLDKIATYGSTGLWPAHENLCWNSDAATNTLGWGSLAGSSPTRVTAVKLFGQASMRAAVTVGSTTQLTFESGGVGVGNTFTAGKWYSAWAWVLLSTNWQSNGGGNLRIQQYRMDDSTSAEEFMDADAAHNGGANWQFVQTLWQQDATAQGGVKFKVQSPGLPTGSGNNITVAGLNIAEFDSFHDITLGPNVLTDGAADEHTYGLCTADSSSFSTAQSWFMARIRAGFRKGWSTRQTRKHTILGWYDDANNYIHAYYQESAGTAGAYVLERCNGGTLDQHVVDAASPLTIDTLRTERDYATVCFTWTNSELAISVDGGNFDTDSSISTNGIPAVVNPLIEIGSLNEGDHLCGDVVWAAAGSGTIDNTEVAALYDSGSDALPTVFDGADAQFFAWDANDATAGDGITEFSLHQNGNVRYDELRMVVQPVTQKDPGDSWTISRDVVVANRVPRSFVNYALDVTDGGLDTATSVSGGDMQADGDDFRVLVDGIEVPRWFGEDAGVNDFDSAATTCWINIDLSPGEDATLATAVSDSDTTFVFSEGHLAGWPRAGFALIESECIRYTSRTDKTMSGVTRGERGTTAAAHSADVVAYWVQRRVQFMYGYTAATAPDARPDLKPMIALDDSTNELLHWDNASECFDINNPRRSMQWSRVLREVEAGQNRFALSSGSSDPLAWYYRESGPLPGEIPGNTFAVYLPTGSGEDGNSDVLTFDGGTDITTRVRAFGVDTLGNRRFLGAFDPSEVGGESNEIESPGFDLVSVELVGSLGRVVGTPARSEAADIFPSSLTDVPVSLAVGESYRQPFTVPSSKSIGAGSISVAQANLYVGGSGWSGSFTARLQKEDPDNLGSYSTIATKVTSVTGSIISPSHGYRSLNFIFAAPVPVLPGDELVLEVEFTSSNGHVALPDNTSAWSGATMSYKGAVTVRDFWLVSDDLDNDGIVEVPPDGSGTSVDNIEVHLNADGVPAIVLGAEQTDAYYIDGEIENATTGQSVTVQALVAVGDELEIDMETGAVANLTQNLSIANLATFSDDDDLVELAPGKNDFTYTEADLVAVAIKAYYRHIWQ